MSEERKILKWSAHTDVGRFRSNNEDSFLALQVNGEGVFRLGKWGEAEIGTSDFVFAVSDGMGGANAGEYASHLVAEQMTQLFPKVFQRQAQGMTVYFQDVLNELVTNVHSSLSDMGDCYSELEGMGATLSLCWVRSSCLSIPFTKWSISGSLMMPLLAQDRSSDAAPAETTIDRILLAS